MAERGGSGGAPRRDSGEVDPFRAVVVVLCFLIAVVLLFGFVVKRQGPVATTTTTTVTIPPRTIVPNQTTVQVANGTSVPNQATRYTQKLQPYGWVMQPPLDAHPATPVTHTIIYFAPTWQPAAKMVAEQLGVSTSYVTVRTGATGVAGAAADQVIVVVGHDLAGR